MDYYAENELGVKIISVLGIILFGWCLFYSLKRLFTAGVVLIVDEKGITDNSSAIAVGFIGWLDIEDIYIADNRVHNKYGSKIKFIEIKVKDNEKYLGKLSFFKKKMLRLNILSGTEVICINLVGTGVKPNNLLVDMKTLFELYKK